jgi:hypothetical protein
VAASAWVRAPQDAWLIAQQGACGEEDRRIDYDKVVSRLGDGAVDLALCAAHDGQEEQRAEDDPQQWERGALHLASSDASSGTSTLNNSAPIATSPPLSLSTSERT